MKDIKAKVALFKIDKVNKNGNLVTRKEADNLIKKYEEGNLDFVSKVFKDGSIPVFFNNKRYQNFGGFDSEEILVGKMTDLYIEGEFCYAELELINIPESNKIIKYVESDVFLPVAVEAEFFDKEYNEVSIKSLHSLKIMYPETNNSQEPEFAIRLI